MTTLVKVLSTWLILLTWFQLELITQDEKKGNWRITSIWAWGIGIPAIAWFLSYFGLLEHFGRYSLVFPVLFTALFVIVDGWHSGKISLPDFWEVINRGILPLLLLQESWLHGLTSSWPLIWKILGLGGFVVSLIYADNWLFDWSLRNRTFDQWLDGVFLVGRPWFGFTLLARKIPKDGLYVPAPGPSDPTAALDAFVRYGGVRLKGYLHFPAGALRKPQIYHEAGEELKADYERLRIKGSVVLSLSMLALLWIASRLTTVPDWYGLAMAAFVGGGVLWFAAISKALSDVEALNEHFANYEPSGALGSAHEATTEEIEAGGMLWQSGIRLGFDAKTGRVIRYNGEGHLFLAAPPRSGKGSHILVPALLEYPYSSIIIDPKGQLAAITKRQREKFGPVLVLNSFGTLPHCLGRHSARYNPMDSLDPRSEAFGVECDSLADAIVMNAGHGDHWLDSARQLIAGTIMQLAANHPPEERNLAMLRRIIATEPYNFARAAMGTADEFTKHKLGRFAAPGAWDNKEIQSIISTADTQTGFIGSAIAKNLATSDFSFRELKRSPITVYVVLPARFLNTCGKWFRLIIASALNALLREERGVPVLMVLDEFGQLGNLGAISNALCMSAGMGLQLWPILQNLTQLKDHYGAGWETFLAAADVQQFFAPQDNFTAEYLSKLCGLRAVVTRNTSVGTSESANGGNQSTNTGYTETQHPLFEPYETKRLGRDESLIIAPGVHNVIKAKRAAYFNTQRYPEFIGRYDTDPYHDRAASVAETEVNA